MEYQYIIVEKAARAFTSLIRLNRPKELNALNLGLMRELAQA
ncbi:MAG TPA: enoyl-CoA hydratase, partial [Bacteroidetes bacterium]|nr:enoyl-CoA hydratase [Bacteroidota bacterium]